MHISEQGSQVGTGAPGSAGDSHLSAVPMLEWGPGLPKLPIFQEKSLNLYFSFEIS